ncbi:hypothetical protein PQR25_19350 [Paraburkholderia nemoris]|uniref:hypothetical protein n=1 Tax=Paraburkholderia nemoris TaxID=2793076 RepID=UPI0038BA1316
MGPQTGLSGPAPELVLLDVNLPDGSGESVLREIRASPEWAAIPVVILSADVQSS